jgi:hypothetical protein
MEWSDPPADLTGHVVICNASARLRAIVAELHADAVVEKPDVVLVLQDAECWAAHPEWHPDPSGDFTREHFHVLKREGGPARPENLRAAGVTRARAAVILADPRQGDLADAHTTLVALAIEALASRVHTVVELLSVENRKHLQSTAVDEVICIGQVAERLLAQSCVSPGIKWVLESLLRNTPRAPHVCQAMLPASLVGVTYRDLARRTIRGGLPFVLCGFIRPGRPPTAPGGVGTDLAIVLNPGVGDDPGRDTPLREGDRMILLAHERVDLERCLLALDLADRS